MGGGIGVETTLGELIAAVSDEVGLLPLANRDKNILVAHILRHLLVRHHVRIEATGFCGEGLDFSAN